MAAPIQNYILLLVLLFFMLQGCHDYCEEMIEKKCNCQKSYQEKMSCREKASLIGKSKNYSNKQQQEICRKVIQKCDCQKLKQKTAKSAQLCAVAYGLNDDGE